MSKRNPFHRSLCWLELTCNRWKPSETTSKKPETLRDENYYTGNLKGYAYFNAVQNYKQKLRENKQAWETWNKGQKKEEGIEEKQAAIEKLILELEEAEKSLLKAGGKTFAELYPDTPAHQGHNRFGYNYQPTEPSPYETTLTFNTPELNPAKTEGYIRLFDAAWDNDLDKVKALTLTPWKCNEGAPLESPLKIAITDGNGFSPFSIAVLRGHYDLARKIVEVCMAQYHKDDGVSSRQRWTMRNGDSDEEDNSDDSYEHDEGELRICNCFCLMLNRSRSSPHLCRTGQ